MTRQTRAIFLDAGDVRPISLACHPATPATAVECIEARAWRRPDGVLALTFSLTGDLGSVRISDARSPRMTDRLWEHTCLEVFVAAEGAEAYHEFNLSPSGEWMAHAFRRYRDGGPLTDDGLNPQIATRQHDRLFELTATLRLNRLCAEYERRMLHVGLSAVIEDAHGSLSYWALRHPAGRPDFHHPDAFALRLDAPHMDGDEDPR